MNKPSGTLKIRQGTNEDLSLILEFIREIADYEKLSHEVVTTEDILKGNLFGEKKYAEVIIAEFEGKSVGYAIFFHNFSTFLGKKGLYLEDLYIRPQYRKKGFGKKLFLHVRGIAKERNCQRLEWSVLDWNTSAIEFYESLGAKSMSDWTVYRLDTKTQLATLAGGCFWGVEEIFRKINGIITTTVGYTGGPALDNLSYELVKTGTTGHAEAVQIEFDPEKISYDEILDYFFRLHDPTTLNRQQNDVGAQYRSAIFCHDESQKEIALKIKEKMSLSGRWKNEIVTEILPFERWHSAEDYHQEYLKKNPQGYNCHFLRD